MATFPGPGMGVVDAALAKALLKKQLGKVADRPSKAASASIERSSANSYAKTAEQLAKEADDALVASAQSKAQYLPEAAKNRIAELHETVGLKGITPNVIEKDFETHLPILMKEIRIEGGKFNIAPQSKQAVFQTPEGKVVAEPMAAFLARGSKPPAEGYQLLNISEPELMKLLPPRPVIEPVRPAASAPPPPPPQQTPSQASAAPSAAPPTMPFVSTGHRPISGNHGPESTYVPPGSGPTVDLARETLQKGPMSAPARYALAATPIAAAGGVGYLANQAKNGPYGSGDYGSDITEPGMTEPGSGIISGNKVFPIFNQPNEPRQWRDEEPPYMSPREESPNLDDIQYMGHSGSSVSYDPSDFVSNNIADPYGAHEQRDFFPNSVPERRNFTGPGVSYDRSDFAPNSTVSAAREVIKRAGNSPQAQAQRAASVLQQSPNELTVNRGSDQGPSAITRFIRGDFSEGSDKRIMEAMKRQREESGIEESGRASGGAAPKKQSRDDVLHKALEIIHHILRR